MRHRDNFLEVVESWIRYVYACIAAGHKPVALEEFRRMESEWDETKGTNA